MNSKFLQKIGGVAVLIAVFMLATGSAKAQQTGVSSLGVTGGLVVPSAFVLEPGTLVLSAGNYREPKFGITGRNRNYSLGVGLLPYVEVFGRFADYTDPIPGSILSSGVRDLSANVKVQLPPFWSTLPNLAVGVNDISGGASFFKSTYVVASDQLGPLRWSLGFASGKRPSNAAGQAAVFKGGFAGAEFLLGNTGAAALAEYDGQQKHLGLRYYSPKLASLGDANVVATLQRSFGATRSTGQKADASSVAVSLVMPLGAAGKKAEATPKNALPPLDAKRESALVATAADRLDSLQRALTAVGLERVRVGTLANNLVVEYENQRYGHNEADAMGVVLGLAAEHAPVGVQRAYAVSLKAGLRVYEISVDIPSYRAFLRDGDAANVRANMSFDRAPAYVQADVKWVSALPSRRSPVRLEIKPDFNYAVATEVGAIDYSLAANVQGIVPVWDGAELYTSFVQRLTNTDNAETGRVFENLRQPNGLKSAAIQQSFWVSDSMIANVGVGRFNYGAFGVQAESTVYLPNSQDVVRLRGARYNRAIVEGASTKGAYSGSYRWVQSPNTWLEAGYQAYSDGSRGPALSMTRWFGDVGLQLFYRKGGERQFAGLELSIPLTPRQGDTPSTIAFSGTQRFEKGIRTRITDSNSAANAVDINAVRDTQLDYNAEVRQLNSGRVGQGYFASQIYRMREAFFLFARQHAGQ